MRNFTEADISVSGFIHTAPEDLIEAPLQWQREGRQQTATGYGAKLTTSRKIRFNGKEYRIYCTCYSNSGTCWFTVKGRRINVS